MSENTFGPSKLELVIFCGFLMTLSGFSVDAMLPAFTQMATDLKTPVANAQLTVSVFAIAFGLSQIFYGPASDRFGRKSVLTVGLAIFLMGSTLAAFGSNITWVLIGRALQGVGGAAAPVLGRAILRDTHSGQELARAMATTMAVFAIGPIVAPLVGYGLMAAASWRYIFFAMGFLAFTLSLFNMLRYQETIPERNFKALAIWGLWTAISTILSNRQSRYFIGCAALGYCALFTFLGNSPVVYEKAFGIKGIEFALLFSATAIAIVFGQIINRKLIAVMDVLKLLRVSGFVLLAASGLMFVLSFIDALSGGSLTALLFLFNTSFLSVISNSASLSIDPHPNHAGMASAIFGFVTSASGAIFLGLTAPIVDGDPLIYSALMMVATLFVFLVLLLFNPRKHDLTMT